MPKNEKGAVLLFSFQVPNQGFKSLLNQNDLKGIFVVCLSMLWPVTSFSDEMGQTVIASCLCLSPPEILMTSCLTTDLIHRRCLRVARN